MIPRHPRRLVAARHLALSVQRFYAEHVGEFLCPTCLGWIDPNDADKITEAHVTPHASGGRAWTVLCRRCNSMFGTRNDKWFGEYLILRRHDHATALHSDKQKGYFYIGSTRVSGHYRIRDTGPLEFFIRVDKLGPAQRRALAVELPRQVRRLSWSVPEAHEPSSLTISVPTPPIVENSDKIALGFLTAAYLMWFDAFGYNWVLQQHLDVVRQQIFSEQFDVLPKSTIRVIDVPKGLQPWIGFGRIADQLALLAGVENLIALFPPLDSPDFYERLTSSSPGSALDIVGQIEFEPGQRVTEPIGVIYTDRLVMAPDVFFSERLPVLVVPTEGPMQVLHAIQGADSFADLQRRHPDRGLKIRSRIQLPTRHTAR